MTNLRRILVVDDEPGIVRAVQRELAAMSPRRYEVEGFSDPRQALERVRSQAFDAVISDYRMPEMDGLQLLTAIAAIQPDCMRLVLSGQTDMDGLIRMINETRIYRFIAKPWQEHDLRGALAQALEYRDMVVEHRRLAALVRRDETAAAAAPERDVDLLLIVDDDTGVLNSLARLLTRPSRADNLFAGAYGERGQFGAVNWQPDLVSVQVSPSPLHALKMAESVTFSCILADYMMPEMNGIELLSRFAARQPDCMRMLISGHADEEALIGALGEASIFAFIRKPWSDYDLKAQIALALAHRRMQRENRALAALAG